MISRHVCALQADGCPQMQGNLPFRTYSSPGKEHMEVKSSKECDTLEDCASTCRKPEVKVRRPPTLFWLNHLLEDMNMSVFFS